jgi:hypothetical protein
VNAMKVAKHLQITAVCGLIVFALASAIPSQHVTADQPGAGMSCSAPRNEEERWQCAVSERRILDATVFLRFTLHCGHNGDRSQVALVPSHATIIDSRTLLTHDHYYPLSDPHCNVVALEVAKVSGEMLGEIEDAAALEALARQLRPNPAGNGAQIRMIRFQTPLFTHVPQLTFEATNRLTSHAAFEYTGELAEINWESFPKATRVQWVRPVALERRGSALGLVVDQAVEIGASGGGVFRITPDGISHVGNIWGTWKDDNTSIVALNQAVAPW